MVPLFHGLHATAASAVPGPRVRGPLSALLVLGAILSVPLVIAAAWVQLVLLDSDAFADMTDDMLAREEVRMALREEIANEVQTRIPEARQPGGRFVITRAAETALDTGTFRAVFREAVRSSHDQLARGEPQLTLQLGDVLPIVIDQLPAGVPGLESALAGRSLPIQVTLVERDNRPELWAAFELVRDGSVIVLIGAVVLAAVAVGFARDRGQALAFTGFGGAAMAVGTVLFVPYASRPVTAGQEQVLRSGVDAAWEVLASTAQIIGLSMAGALAAAGIAGVLIFLATRPRGKRAHRRRSARPARAR